MKLTAVLNASGSENPEKPCGLSGNDALEYQDEEEKDHARQN